MSNFPRDKKVLVFGVLNLVQGLAVGAIPVFASSRIDAVNVVLAVASSLMIVAAPSVVFGGIWGRRFVAAVCVLYWILGLTGAVAIFGSVSYLYGIYGHHGASAGLLGIVVAFLVLVVFWLIPGHEIEFLRRKKVGN